MSVILWPFLLALDLLAFVLAPILVLLALPFTQQTTKASGKPCMPFAWLNTPDDVTGDQGMYEPMVRSIHSTVNWYAAKQWGFKLWRWTFMTPALPHEAIAFYVKTWYWLGVRNTFGGLWDKMARPGLPVYQTGSFVQTKGPYRAGWWFGRSEAAWEFDAVWGWTAAKCAAIRLGWRVHDGSGTFLFQVRPWITRDSTT